ncbi:MAG TPA: oligosaccharide flippase family protein, partial [Pseudolabrys sp.]
MALLRHSGIYFLARIFAGGASFAIIAAYTRLLDPHAFGELALAMAGVTFFVALIGDSPTMSMLRFLPGDKRAARATTLWGLILPAAALCCAVVPVILFAAPDHWRIQLTICAALLIVTLLHKFQLATAQGAFRPGQYAWLGSAESVLDMVLGIGLVALGFGVSGALLGTTLALLAVLTANWRGWWVDRKFFDAALGRQMLRFGVPLIVSNLFIWLATFGDRWLLAAFFNADQAGLYAAGYDLQMNLLGVPMAVIALAGYPLTINAYTERGAQAAQTQLRLLGSFIILIVLPEAVGIVMTGPLLVNIFLGEEFRPLTLSLLPILVSATFLKALLIYVNYGYFLGARTGFTLLSMAVAAVVDLMLNIMLIPRYGPTGSAVAALIGFGAGFAIAVMKMPRVFPFPLPDPAILTGGLLGVVAMAAWLWPFHLVTAWGAVFYVIPVAILVYFGVVFLVLHLLGRKPLELIGGLW